jgi:penicillin-binding protein 1A
LPLRRRPHRTPKNGKRRIRKRRLTALLGVLAVLSVASFTFGFVTAIGSQIPKLDPAKQDHRERDGYIYDRDEKNPRVLAVLRGSESRIIVESDDIAPMMKHAIVAVEDRRFYEHRGVDLRAIGRAFWADVRNKKVVQGGSTITQQFIKNALIKDRRSVARKLKEAALAWQLEQRWQKERILTAYLNTIYFGNGAYGVEQAARTYFDKRAIDLTLPEAALLAGIPPDPSGYDPVTNPRAAKLRRRLVLERMLDQGLITQADFDTARSAALPSPEKIKLPGTEGPAGHYFVNYVKQQLIDEYGAGRVFGGGLRVRTTIDLRLQQIARAAIAKTLDDPEGPQAALVAVNPKNGEILAMVGGSNFRDSQFNLAVQGERQPGSAFKPFVLAAALREGISPATQFVSEKTVISLGDRLWEVNNYEGSYLGSIDLETATVHSDNAVYAQLTELIGPKSVARMARDAGIRSRLNNNFAIGLGAEAANPLEMARAFSTFANGGLRVDGSKFGDRPRAVISVSGVENRPVGRRALGPSRTALLNSILQKVLTQGTGRRAALPDRPAAGKTGTTENYGDAWFVGYTPELAAAVWVGYPKGLRPMLTEYHGEAVAGGTFPAEIWKTFMQAANAYKQDEPTTFPTPSIPYALSQLVVLRDGRLQVDNGNCRSAKHVFFFSGASPDGRANCRENEVDVPDLVGMRVSMARERLISQPLTPRYIFKPAQARQRLDVVIGQIPEKGNRLSAYDEVKLVLPKPTHGVVPRLIGLSFQRAKAKLERRKLQFEVTEVDEGRAGEVVFQVPKPGVAARPGMVVKLAVVRRG